MVKERNERIRKPFTSKNFKLGECVRQGGVIRQGVRRAVRGGGKSVQGVGNMISCFLFSLSFFDLGTTQ